MNHHTASADPHWPEDVALIQLWSETLRQEIREYHRKMRYRMFRRVALAVALIAAFWAFGSNAWNFWWVWLFFGGGAAVDLAADSRRELATSLTNSDDPRVVNVLALAARDGDPETRKVAASGLIKLLPRMKASDRDTITDEGMDALIALLKRGDVDLDFSILRALEQVGDARAIPLVEAFTRIHPKSPESRSLLNGEWERRTYGDKLRMAAEECLSHLRERAEEDCARLTLLRAAGTPDSVELLLRPAKQSEESQNELLLRPTEDA